MATLYEKLHPVFLYSVVGTENLGPCNGVYIERGGGGGGGGEAIPADALCFSRLMSCVFTSFILLRHSRSNSLK